MAWELLNEVGAAAQQLMQRTGAKDEIVAFHNAIEFHLKHLAEKQTLLERLKPHLDQIQDAGEFAGEFDVKAFLDEM